MESAPTRPTRVAVVGAGVIGTRRARYACQSAKSQVVVVADISAERADAVARELECAATTDWAMAVRRSDIDAIVVSCSNDALYAVSRAALEAGKHVLTEKPLARTVAEAEALVSAARHRGVVLKTGFNHRYHPAMLEMRRRFDLGDFGPPLFARCRYGHGGRPHYEREWRGQGHISGGGELLDQGIHACDLFRWFLGDMVQATGFVTTAYWPMGVEDNGFGLFRSAGGAVASVHASWTQWKNIFSFELFGRDGYAIMEGLGGSYGTEHLTVGRRRPESGPPLEKLIEIASQDASWGLEWEDFMSSIHEGREPLGSGRDGLEALRMVHGVYEASRSSTTVTLVPSGA